MKATLVCKDCKKKFIVDADTPLTELIVQGKVDRGHLWHFGRKYSLRHATKRDYEETEDIPEAWREWEP